MTKYEKALKQTKNDVRKRAYNRFLKNLDNAINALYVCEMENNAAVLSMDIKSLHSEMSKINPFDTTRCDSCGEKYTKKDIAGGRCSCGTMIC
jgi:hypothetical protein